MSKNRPEIPSNVVYIGKDRSITDYALPIMTMMNNGETEIIVKSRGVCNNSNLSLNQYLLNKIFKGKLHVKSIDIGTEELRNKDKRLVNVTCLSLVYSVVK